MDHTDYPWRQEYVPGERYTGGAGQRSRDTRAYGALRALDPATGERRWEFEYISPSTSGLLTTASGALSSTMTREIVMRDPTTRFAIVGVGARLSRISEIGPPVGVLDQAERLDRAGSDAACRTSGTDRRPECQGAAAISNS